LCIYLFIYVCIYLNIYLFITFNRTKVINIAETGDGGDQKHRSAILEKSPE